MRRTIGVLHKQNNRRRNEHNKNELVLVTKQYTESKILTCNVTNGLTGPKSAKKRAVKT